MATFGRYKVGWNRKANAGTIIFNVVALIIWLAVGDKVISAVRDSGIMNVNESSLFYQAYNFLGLTGLNQSQGLIGIIGILLAVGVILQAFRISRIR